MLWQRLFRERKAVIITHFSERERRGGGKESKVLFGLVRGKKIIRGLLVGEEKSQLMVLEKEESKQEAFLSFLQDRTQREGGKRPTPREREWKNEVLPFQEKESGGGEREERKGVAFTLARRVGVRTLLPYLERREGEEKKGKNPCDVL